MAGKKFWMGILVMALVFGLAVVGCDNGSTSGSGTDSRLNGTWVDGDTKIFLDGGIFELSVDSSPFVSGTYTTNGNRITITPTHAYGGNSVFMSMLQSKWYTKSELKASPIGILYGELIDEYFAQQTEEYSINGNKLTMVLEGETVTLTRQ